MRGGVVLPCDFIIFTPCKDDFKDVSDAQSAILEGYSMRLVISGVLNCF
jgi:hypothetical protein